MGLPPLRGCLLSGGASRRMGRDKALLPHPQGGNWLEHTLRLLLELRIPVTLFSRHEGHLQLAQELAASSVAQSERSQTRRSISGAILDRDPLDNPAWSSTAAGNAAPPAPAELTALAEPEPWEGPLLALQRLMELYPDQRLLLCPVDMPWLTLAVLRSLRTAAAEQPQRIHLAHDGLRLQPLLGLYPSLTPLRADLSAAVHRGERRLQSWLAGQPFVAVELDRRALRNVNRPGDLPAAPAQSVIH